MIPDCISFQSIPHTSKIFGDFLSNSPEIRKFYPHLPEADSLTTLARTLPRNHERQAAVADVLARQNRAWGASEATLHNIERLREGAFAVVTGQQVGLFGGPTLSLMKAASVLALARQMATSGVECVPVFWMATEDHDLAEVNHSVFLAHDFQLSSFATNTIGVANSPVANIRFGEGTNETVERVAELLGNSTAVDYLRQSYREGETLSHAYAKLYTLIFGEHGLILLDPSDAELHRIATPLFLAAARRAPELDASLLDRNRQLSAMQYHEQVKVTDESTLLFAIVEGARVPVHRANGGFAIARERFSLEQLEEQITDHPEEFNANVLLRPVLQDFWLPTLAYVGGPAEIAYFAQAGVVYETLLGRITPILPRLSATLIEPRIERLLTRYNLDLTEIFQGERQLRDCLAAKTLPANLKQSFAQGVQAVEAAMRRIATELDQLDPTLVEAAGRATSKMRYQVGRLEKRAGHAELRRNEILVRHAAQIENSLYPQKSLQEREIGALYFYAKHGPELIERLIESAQARCPEHKIITLG